MHLQLVKLRRPEMKGFCKGADVSFLTGFTGHYELRGNTESKISDKIDHFHKQKYVSDCKIILSIAAKFRDFPSRETSGFHGNGRCSGNRVGI